MATKHPGSTTLVNMLKKNLKTITFSIKIEIIKHFESTEQVVDIANHYSTPTTVQTIKMYAKKLVIISMYILVNYYW